MVDRIEWSHLRSDLNKPHVTVVIEGGCCQEVHVVDAQGKAIEFTLTINDRDADIDPENDPVMYCFDCERRGPSSDFEPSDGNRNARFVCPDCGGINVACDTSPEGT